MSRVLDILEKKYVFATPDDIEVLYLFKDGVYVQGETIIKSEIEEILGDKTKTNFCNEVLNHFKRRSYTSRTNFNVFNDEIPVLNGLLNLKTMEINDFNPEKIFTFKINTKFDSNKNCEKFKEKLKQILPKDDDRALLQEYVGYTLLPEFPHHKFIVFIGTGRNGKGVIIRTIENIIGKDNVSNIRLEHLDGSHRFMVANLFGKLMNICSEPATRRPFKTELLKQITGQDTIDGEIKNKQKPLKFNSFAKFYIQANKLPRVDDITLSFWDRINIIEFTETFTDEKGNKTAKLENTWLEDEDERSGVLNWMIEGLKRLKENGKFTQTKSMAQQIIKFKQVSDPMGAFLVDPEECMYAPILWVTRNDLYNAYKDYAENIGAKIETTGVFAERIKRIPGVASRKKRVKGVNERIWTGISIITKNITLEDYEENGQQEISYGASGAAKHPFSSADLKKTNNNIEGETPAPSAPSAPFLQDKIENVLSYIREHDEASEYEMIEDLDMDLDELRKILKLLLRDGTIFCPRVGVYKIS